MGNGVAGPMSYVPLGWSSVVPGIREGHPLRYFTPAPLSSLIEYVHSVERVEEPRASFSDEALACLIYGAVIRGRFDNSFMPRMREGAVALYRDYILDRRSIRTRDQLISIAVRLTGVHASHLREEIVYAGPVAHPDSLLFAREDAVASLVDDLIEVLATLDETYDASDLSAIVMFCFLGIHPFLDGNGRTARFLSAYAASRQSATLSGALLAGIQYWHRAWFESVATEARDAGMSSYLIACKAMTSSAMSSLGEAGLLSQVERIDRLIPTLEANATNVRRLLLEGLLTGAISMRSLRRYGGLAADAGATLWSALLPSNEEEASGKGVVDVLPLQRSVAEAFRAIAT